jgi:hypothetical protein
LPGDLPARFLAPAFFITNSQTQLLLAEAKFRGWITGGSTTQQYYEAGFKAAMDVSPKILTISERNGTFPGMPAERKFTCLIMKIKALLVIVPGHVFAFIIERLFFSLVGYIFRWQCTELLFE